MTDADALIAPALGAAAQDWSPFVLVAGLLAARTPPHPFALLVGLNLGPNLFVTGSLAWILWLRAARAAGAHPSVPTAARFGGMAVPLSIAAPLGALAVTGSL